MAQEDAVLFPLHDLKESSEKVKLVPAFKQKSEAYRSCNYSKKIISQPQSHIVGTTPIFNGTIFGCVTNTYPNPTENQFITVFRLSNYLSLLFCMLCNT